MLFRTLIFGFIFTLILDVFGKISCVPLNSDREREDAAKQLDFPNENEIIPDVIVPRDQTAPNTPNIPRQFPGFPGRRGRGAQSEGLITRIVNFFKNILGMGTPNMYPNGEGGVDGMNPNDSGVFGFIRRTFSGLFNRIMSLFGGTGTQVPINPEAVEFPYQRPRLEPLRRN